MTTTEHSGRRSFMKLLGGVLGAGVGLAVTGSASANPKDGAGVACAIYCATTTPSCESCGTGRRWFRCVNQCDGSVSYPCYQRSCAGFCLSQSAC